MKNKGKILVFLASFALLFTILSPVFAETKTGFVEAGTSAGYDISKRDITSYIQLVINFILSIVAFAFFTMILYGGLRWMTSRGQEQLKEKAMDAITNAVIGLAVVVGAYALVTFVFSRLVVSSPSTTVESPATQTEKIDTGDNGCCVTQNSSGPACRVVKKDKCAGQWFGNQLCQPSWCGSGSADRNRDQGAI